MRGPAGDGDDGWHPSELSGAQRTGFRSFRYREGSIPIVGVVVGGGNKPIPKSPEPPSDHILDLKKKKKTDLNQYQMIYRFFQDR